MLQKVSFIFILIIYHFSFCHAQDTVVFKNGKTITGKVTSTDDFVNFTDARGKNRYHSIQSVVYIRYANGNKWIPYKPVLSHNDSNLAAHKKLFSIYNDPSQGLFCESGNIGIEHPISQRITLGINVAMVHPQTAFLVNPLSAAQANWPGTIYYGYSVRMYMKVFDKYHPARYTGFQFVCKSLWYRNVTFYDQPEQYGDNGVNYTRNEDETVLGIDLVRGHEYAVLNNSILIDYYYGLGMHDRLRHIDTWNISSTLEASADNIVNGYSFQNIVLPSPIVGVRIGFNFYKRPEKKFPITIGLPFPANDSNYVRTYKTQKLRYDSLNSFKKGIRLYTDLVQDVVNEYNIGLEYCFNPAFSMGINAGIAHTFGWEYYIDRGFYGNNAYIIESGNAARFFLKYYSKKNPHSYWSIQLVYKTFWANSGATFVVPIETHSVVFGEDIIHGHEIWTRNKRLFFDLYYGLGIREESGIIQGPDRFGNAGTDKEHYVYPAPVADINIGYRIFK